MNKELDEADHLLCLLGGVHKSSLAHLIIC